MPGATLGAVPLTSLKDRTAVVTGGASGIGRALALLFAREGANVVVADLDAAGMAETVAGVGPAGRRAVAVQTGVSRRAGRVGRRPGGVTTGGPGCSAGGGGTPRPGGGPVPARPRSVRGGGGGGAARSS